MGKKLFLAVVILLVAIAVVQSFRKMMEGVAEMEADQYGHGEPPRGHGVGVNIED